MWQANLSETILWRRIDLPGHEIATLDPWDGGWRLAGTAVFLTESGPSKLDYTVVCSSEWWTESAQVSGIIGGQYVNRSVSVDSDRRWYLNGVECADVEGSLDIDLGFSPSTNLLPIRRLGLAIGERAEVNAAWLPFPSLEFQLLRQIYSREGENIYRYESGGGAFIKTLKANSSGFVTDYPGLWRAEVTHK